MAAKVSQAELEVLSALLELKRGTAREVHDRLKSGPGWAHPTVVTFLRRLEAKGLVGHSEVPGRRSFLYKPTRRGRATRGRAVRDLLDRAFGGDPLPLVSSLIEEANLSTDQIEELRDMLAERTEKNSGKGRNRK